MLCMKLFTKTVFFENLFGWTCQTDIFAKTTCMICETHEVVIIEFKCSIIIVSWTNCQ